MGAGSLIRTRDAINDEIEIRLFESDLEVNLERLHSKLKSYEKNVPKPTIGYLIHFQKVMTTNDLMSFHASKKTS